MRGGYGGIGLQVGKYIYRRNKQLCLFCFNHFIAYICKYLAKGGRTGHSPN